jgi:sec-independent protein translocase protein TatA
MSLNPVTIIVVLLLGVLFFGKNLPQVARQLGSALIEFRKGVNEWKETAKAEILKDGEKKAGKAATAADETFKPTGTKFVPPE